MQILVAPLAMYAAMKTAGLKTEELDAFATYLEQLPDSEAPRGRMSDYDRWFSNHIQAFRRSENVLFRKPPTKMHSIQPS